MPLQASIGNNDPDYEDNLDQRSDNMDWRLSHLTKGGLEIYKQDLEQYRFEELIFRAQRNSIDKFQKFIFDTVNPKFILFCCILNQTYKQWYTNL
jgi:hypothetical protein